MADDLAPPAPLPPWARPLTYVGPAYIPGLPARDLTAIEVAVWMTEALVATVLELGLYKEST